MWAIGSVRERASLVEGAVYEKALKEEGKEAKVVRVGRGCAMKSV